MGAWGTGLYQNDSGMDVKSEYIMLLRQGKSDEKALEEIYDSYAYEMEEYDDKYDVCFALADTMWKYGRLVDKVREKALKLIEEGGDEERWADSKEKDQAKRKAVVGKLKKQLLSEMPARKRVSVHKPYVTKWKPQEVYLYQIKNPPEGKEEYLGWYIIIFVDEIRGHEFVVPGVKDITPDIYIKVTQERPQKRLDVDDAVFVCLMREPETGMGRFRATFSEVSDRKYPKDLEFLGNYADFKYPEMELPHYSLGGLIEWYSIEEDVILGYENELTRLAEIEEREKKQ